MNQIVGKALYIVAAGPRVNALADRSLFLDVNLGVTCDTRAEVGRKGDSLVESVGVQTLGVAQGSSHSLDAGTSHIVERILLGERPTRSLAVGTQSETLRILGIELVDQFGPKHTSGAHLSDLHEVVHADCPEEAEARSESVDVDAGLDTCAEVLQTIGEGVCHLDVIGCTCFLHVVT